jgi:FOG: CBS domain
VRDIMTGEVLTVPPSMPITQLIELMFQSKHASYPVVDNGTLVGLITFGNVHHVPADRRDDIMVGNVMTRNVEPAKPDDDASEAFIKLAQQKLGSIPVVQDGNVVGIVTQKDVTSSMTLLGEARDQNLVEAGPNEREPRSASTDYRCRHSAHLRREYSGSAADH